MSLEKQEIFLCFVPYGFVPPMGLHGAVVWRYLVKRDEPVRYVCADCGHMTTTRTGRCPSCGAWGTLEAEAGPAAQPRGAAARVVSAVDVRPPQCLSTGIGELH